MYLLTYVFTCSLCAVDVTAFVDLALSLGFILLVSIWFGLRTYRSSHRLLVIYYGAHVES